MKHFVYALVVIGIVASVANADPILLNTDNIAKTGLTKQQAKQVLILVLEHDKFRLSAPGMFIDDDLQGPNGEPNRPGYFDFSLSYDTPKAGASAYLGYYSVNIKTGDVWEVESCIHYDFPELRKLQHKIVHQTGIHLLKEEVARNEVGCPPKEGVRHLKSR